MGKMAKKVICAQYAHKFQSIFQCPICKSNMVVVENKSLACLNKHAFDFAKQGYLNLLTTQTRSKSKYDKALFEARRKLMVEGEFFEPVCQAISDVIIKQFEKQEGTIAILDTGCGEGTHLSDICHRVDSVKEEIIGAGIDISKDGILVAAKNYVHKIWCVADLANMPFQNHQFDVILNILSPSNYSEFNRLLKEEGLVIKIVPQSGYLQELRSHFFVHSDKQTYSNSETIDRFHEFYQVVQSQRLCYEKYLDEPLMRALLQMTPLTWSVSEAQVQSFLQNGSTKITVDLTLLVGKKFV